ncbi:minor tail domain protein [Enterococcus gallinarum]|uniref:Minor tail domain protein n=1 Tax=Enterococcus gallinarum TaxID=1353 RepID=A0A376L838_ENTGA|nr:minor tail domain protein [Enterococcus gallinarum]
MQANFKNVQRTVSTMADRLNTSFNLTPEMALGTRRIGMSGVASYTNNRNVTKTIHNQPEITMHVTWNGKEDIRKTIEEIAWITTVEDRGDLK